MANGAASFKTFKKTVTTAGTRTALTSSTLQVYEVVVKALASNTGTIYIGDSTVASSNGYELSAGASFSIPLTMIPKTGSVVDLNWIYIDASVNGEGVCVAYLQRTGG